jgi:HlyD family secretion protein
VPAGQVLARFDGATLEAERAQIGAAQAAARALLEQAEADRDHAVREERRTDALFAARGMSGADRDGARVTARLAQQRVPAAEAESLAQRAAYQLAKTNLEHTVIYAPIEGVVITRAVEPGQTVAAMLQTSVLFTVAAALRKMHVSAAVDEADIGEVSTVMSIRGCMELPSQGEYRIEGIAVQELTSDVPAAPRNERFGFVFGTGDHAATRAPQSAARHYRAHGD